MKAMSMGAELLVTHHEALYRIAREAQARSVALLAAYREYIAHATGAAVYMGPTEANDAAVVALTFAAFTGEAFINAYGVEHLPDPAMKQLERLSWEQKWRLFPVLACGREVPDEAVAAMRKLMEARNQLAHAKAGWKDWDNAVEAWARLGHANAGVGEHITALQSAVRALAVVDPRVQTGWLDGRPTDARIR